jgi:hypothetical protein
VSSLALSNILLIPKGFWLNEEINAEERAQIVFHLAAAKKFQEISNHLF